MKSIAWFVVPSALVMVSIALAAGCGSGTSAPGGGDTATHDLVFEGVLDSVPELLAYDASAHAGRRWLPGSLAGLTVMDPEPSPDGAWIAFVAASYDSGTGDIFVMRRDGSDLQQRTFDPELDDQPTWSPDGLRIAFRSHRTLRAGDIWVMDRDGGNPVNLTPDPLPGIIDERRPAWSPDGARIAYAGNEGGNYDIWLMDADGGNRLRLTSTPDLDTEPAWSPDGAWIAFRRSSPDAGSDLCIVPSDSGAVVPIVLAGEQRMPAWYPDGTRLVFVGHQELLDRPDLFSIRTDGTSLQPLVAGAVPGGSLNPAFLRRN